MCGIAGFISKKFHESHLKMMTQKLAHRGPDAEGYYLDNSFGIGLGHRRLSILDLSEAANQPFFSADGRYVMVYNGEVYNFKEVAAKYKIATKTSSDTEVIIEAFALAGIESIKELNGMFAMAIWDTQEQKLFLIRDRVGIKPLFYYVDENDFAFASELKALTALPITKQISRSAINDFLYLGYIPGQQSIYENINKLLPGQYAIFEKGAVACNAYWQLEQKIAKHTINDEQKAQKELKKLLESSVQYCMVSDVPLGVFLSGGVDSSIVAAIAQRHSMQPLKTFSIGFNEAKYNETAFANAVAKAIKSDHVTFTVQEKDAIDLVEKITKIYDEPYADSSAIPTLLVSKLARQEVTVALSGDGGDELFMGYGFYLWAKRLSHPLVKTFRHPIAKMLHLSGDQRLQRGSQMFTYPDKQRKKSHIFSQDQYLFSEIELSRLLIKPSGISIIEQLEFYNRSINEIEAQSFFDIKNYLPEDLLVKTDRASMHHSLEVRVPLLDHRLVEFAINLNVDLKLKGNVTKYLLKQVLYEYLPPALFDRPKWGFAVPLAKWLSSDLRYLIDRYLNRETIEEIGLVHYPVVENLKNDFLKGKSFLYNRLWVLIILHQWMKENN